MPKSTNHRTEEVTKHAQAKALLADIEGAPTTVIPRRDAIVEWLNAFLIRSNQKDHVLGETEAADLIALDQFLRKYDVPAATSAAA